MPAKQCTLDLSIWAVTQRAGFTAGSMAQKTSWCRNNAPNSQTHSHFYKCLSKHPHLVFWFFVVVVLKKVKIWGLAFVLCHLGVPPLAQIKCSCFGSGWNLVTGSGAHLQPVLYKIHLKCKGYFFLTVEIAKDELFKTRLSKNQHVFQSSVGYIFKHHFKLHQGKHFLSVLKYHKNSHSKCCYSIWVVKIREVNPEQTNQTFAPHSVKTNIKIANSR